MLRKFHETNWFHITFLDRNNFKSENGPVTLPLAQVYYFNGRALHVTVGCFGVILLGVMF
jgi:hypothetical protein